MKKPYLNPKDLVIELAEQAAVFQLLYPGKQGRIGEVILKLPEAKRNILKNLKSSDISKIRWPKFR